MFLRKLFLTFFVLLSMAAVLAQEVAFEQTFGLLSDVLGAQGIDFLFTFGLVFAAVYFAGDTAFKSRKGGVEVENKALAVIAGVAGFGTGWYVISNNIRILDFLTPYFVIIMLAFLALLTLNFTRMFQSEDPGKVILRDAGLVAVVMGYGMSTMLFGTLAAWGSLLFVGGLLVFIIEIVRGFWPTAEKVAAERAAGLRSPAVRSEELLVDKDKNLLQEARKAQAAMDKEAGNMVAMSQHLVTLLDKAVELLEGHGPLMSLRPTSGGQQYRIISEQLREIFSAVKNLLRREHGIGDFTKKLIIMTKKLENIKKQEEKINQFFSPSSMSALKDEDIKVKGLNLNMYKRLWPSTRLKKLPKTDNAKASNLIKHLNKYIIAKNKIDMRLQVLEGDVAILEANVKGRLKVIKGLIPAWTPYLLRRNQRLINNLTKARAEAELIRREEAEVARALAGMTALENEIGAIDLKILNDLLELKVFKSMSREDQATPQEEEVEINMGDDDGKPP